MSDEKFKNIINDAYLYGFDDGKVGVFGFNSESVICWSDTPPTEDGYYWMGSPNSCPEIVKIVDDHLLCAGFNEKEPVSDYKGAKWRPAY